MREKVQAHHISTTKKLILVSTSFIRQENINDEFFLEKVN
jgi:hypothetical protein